MSNDNERDDNDNRGRFRNRDRNDDRGAPKREPEVAADPSIIWRIIRNYIMPIIQSVGTDLASTPAALKVLSSLENVVGEDGVKHAAVLGLPLVAAVIQEPVWLKRGLRQLGCPEEVNALIDEMIDEAFEGLRLGITDPKDIPSHKDVEKHLSGPSERAVKKLNEPTYEQLLRQLQPETQTLIEQFFCLLSESHKKRFNALKPKLTSKADLITLMGRIKLVQDLALKHGEPSMFVDELLEQIEPFYGVTPPAPKASKAEPKGFAWWIEKIEHAFKSFTDSLVRPVTAAERQASIDKNEATKRRIKAIRERNAHTTTWN